MWVINTVYLSAWRFDGISRIAHRADRTGSVDWPRQLCLVALSSCCGYVRLSSHRSLCPDDCEREITEYVACPNHGTLEGRRRYSRIAPDSCIASAVASVDSAAETKSSCVF